MATEAMNNRLDRIESRVDANVSDTAELKGAYEHLATKADVERAEKRMQRFILAVATAIVLILTYLEHTKLDSILERLP